MARIFFFAFVCLAGAAGFAAGAGPNAESPRHTLYLEGQFLVAAPKMPDPRFAKTVILMVHHDAAGAMGFVINKLIGHGPLSSFLKGFGIKAKTSAPETVALYYGGPVEFDTAAVLHSLDYKDASTRRIGKNLAWSNRKDVLSAIAAGEGPKKHVFVLGYAGWAAGQLEHEMAREDWFTAPADAALIFDQDPATLWDRVMAKAGVKL